ASEARLYTFSPETLESLRKFRLGTSRASKPQAVIYMIDKETLEIKPKECKAEVFTSLREIPDGLPDHAPRFVLLSYPVTLNSGRQATPYVLLYYMPATANNELKMLYAGAKELMRNTAQVSKVLEVADEEDILRVEEILKE
ncbi:glia maturation factor beta, partial [Tuber magnatum]